MDYSTSTTAQHVKHAARIDAFCENVAVLLDLGANHAEVRVRHAALRAIAAFALLKADPDGPDALCGPKVKDAIERALLLIDGDGGTMN